MENPSMPRARLKWSEAFAAAAGVVATFPSIPAPLHSLSLDTVLGRSLFSASMIALAGSSVFSSRREREQDSNKQSEREKLQEERHNELLRLLGDMRANRATTTTTTAAPQSTKVRLLKLSQEIYEFLVERQQSEPSLALEHRPALMHYTGETVALYGQKFGGRVAAERDALVRAFPDDTLLAGLLRVTINTTGARMVAEKLYALAVQMPD